MVPEGSNELISRKDELREFELSGSDSIVFTRDSQRNRFSMKSRVFEIKVLQKDYLSTRATIWVQNLGRWSLSFFDSNNEVVHEQDILFLLVINTNCD